MPDDATILTELLQGEAWVSKNALFQRSSFIKVEEFNTWLRGLVNAGHAQTHTGPFGIEVALAGTPRLAAGERPAAKAPTAPAGAGPMPPAMPLIPPPSHAPPIHLRSRGFAVPEPETAHRPRSEVLIAAIEKAGQTSANEPPPAPATAAPSATESAPGTQAFGLEPEELIRLRAAEQLHGRSGAGLPAAPEPAAPAAATSTEIPITATAPQAGAEESPMPRKTEKAEPRDLVLQALRTAPSNMPQLVKATKLSAHTIKRLLNELRDEDLVHLEGFARGPTWYVGGSGAKKSAAAKARQPKPAAEPADENVVDALQRLEQRFQPRVVENLDLKVQVLDKLIDLMEPSIGMVLSDIRQDLQAAA